MTNSKKTTDELPQVSQCDICQKNIMCPICIPCGQRFADKTLSRLEQDTHNEIKRIHNWLETARNGMLAKTKSEYKGSIEALEWVLSLIRKERGEMGK